MVAAAGLAAALLPALLHPRLWTLWPVFLASLALAWGFDVLLAPSPRGVTCRASLPPTLPISESGRAQIEVRLASRRPLPVTVALDLSEKLEPQPPAVCRASREAGEVAFRLQPRRRGTVRLEHAWLRYAGPLGLASFVLRRELGGEAAVVPNLRPTRSMALAFASRRELQAGLRIERYSGEGSEFESLKEFRQGDDHRAIGWKASARHGKLICRQFRAERNHQVILATDSGHLMCEPIAGTPKVDHAVTAALVLAYLALKAGDRVGFYSFDARPALFLPPRGGAAAHRALAALSAQVDYTDHETNFTLGLASLAQRLRRRSLVVVLTDFVDTTTAELMAENLGRLARQHAVLFVALQDPQLAAVAGAVPRDPLALHRSVVAGGLLRDRQVVLARLRRLGITALDAAPGEITPAMINAYLDIKRRERV